MKEIQSTFNSNANNSSKSVPSQEDAANQQDAEIKNKRERRSKKEPSFVSESVFVQGTNSFLNFNQPNENSDLSNGSFSSENIDVF